jgi:hypothetical protein
MPAVYTCWYCASVFSNLQVGVVSFNFMKNILILFRQLIQHMGQFHVDKHHFLRRERERSISQIIQSRIQSACLSKIYEPAFKNGKYMSISVRSDKTFVPAELFLCHGENYDLILKLFMKWEHNHSCASYDCVVFKLVLGRFRCKYFTPPYDGQFLTVIYSVPTNPTVWHVACRCTG